MDLSEMLALLPDNSTGAIDAADLRAIVTALYERASTVGEVFGYGWQVSGTPSNGRATVDPPWSTSTTTLRVHETTDSGQTLTFNVLDALSASVIIVGQNDGVMHATITGPSVDQGTYRDIPITVTDVSGIAPINNEKVSVVVRAVVP